MKTIKALTFRKKFGSTLDEVSTKKIHLVISRANRPLAVLVPYEDYLNQMNQKEREKKLRLASVRIDEWRKKHAEALKGSNSVEAIRRLRAER